MRWRWLLAAALVALLPGGRASAGNPPEDDGGPPPPPPPFLAEAATVPTSDGMMLAGTYGAAGQGPGSAAVVLVHMEGETKASWELLYPRLQEHRVAWLAIDLRGYGGSASQKGADLSADARAKSAALEGAMAEDVYGAVRWLIDVKGHDPKRIGVMGAGLGAAAAVRCAHLHKGEIAGLALLTPRLDYPGLDTEADAHDLDGKMEVRILASVEDMNVRGKSPPANDKKGPRHLLYNLEIDRNAPRDTPYDERITKRRGVPPRLRAFGETNIFGTKMIKAEQQLDCWLAAWWARTLGTYPFPVLFDGSVDRENDFADPSWDAGTKVPGPPGFEGRALRWGRRVMVGSEVPKDTRTVQLRISVSRGGQETGQLTTIAIPSGDLTATKVQKRGGRPQEIVASALALPAAEIPLGKGKVDYGNPSFEVEYRLPDFNGKEPYEVRVFLDVILTSGSEEGGPGVDATRYETWAVVPDIDAHEVAPAIPPPKAPGGPAHPAGR